MKGKTIAITALVLVVIVAAVVVLNRVENYDEFYYTQVDNSRISELPAGSDPEMKYEYTLACFSKTNGGKKELKFKTARELRDKAYLLLEVRSAGVYSWEEVQPDSLPDTVRDKFA